MHNLVSGYAQCHFFMPNSNEHRTSIAHKKNAGHYILAFHSECVFIMLTNVKMPAIVGIQTYIMMVIFPAKFHSLSDFFRPAVLDVVPSSKDLRLHTSIEP